MSVIARRVVSTPVRSASDTWDFISKLLAGTDPAGRAELAAVAGVASALISSEAPASDPIVAWGVGPRIRVYCLFNEDAISGDDKSEDALASSPTAGDWSLSLPCPKEDLSWAEKEVAKISTRVTVRQLGETVPVDTDESSGDAGSASVVNEEAFFRS